jgi:hypothetical protein
MMNFFKVYYAGMELLQSNPLAQLKYINIGWVPVAQTCNPNYSGGREQEDWCLQDPISKILSQKIGLVVCLKVKALSYICKLINK